MLAARAALLLRELSSDFQVIYLACSNRYDGLADAVIELPGPAEAESTLTGPISARAAAQSAAVPADTTPKPAGSATKPSRGMATSLLDEARASASEIAAAADAADAEDSGNDEVPAVEDLTVPAPDAAPDAAPDPLDAGKNGA
jgi:hypothetical protein